MVKDVSLCLYSSGHNGALISSEACRHHHSTSNKRGNKCKSSRGRRWSVLAQVDKGNGLLSVRYWSWNNIDGQGLESTRSCIHAECKSACSPEVQLSRAVWAEALCLAASQCLAVGTASWNMLLPSLEGGWTRRSTGVCQCTALGVCSAQLKGGVPGIGVCHLGKSQGPHYSFLQEIKSLFPSPSVPIPGSFSSAFLPLQLFFIPSPSLPVSC